MCIRDSFNATIQWHDNKNIQDDMILKIGDIEEDDDEVFFYLDDDSEIEEYKKDGVHEWKIIDICEIQEDMEGRYMSTYSFVGENDLHDEAENLFGVDWEAVDDVNQIQTLLDVHHPNEYYVSLIPDCKYEDDILVTLKEKEELTIEKAKKFLKDKGYYMDTLWHVDDVKQVFDCDDHDADEVLDLILSDCTQTNEAILWVGLEQGLKEKKDGEQ